MGIEMIQMWRSQKGAGSSKGEETSRGDQARTPLNDRQTRQQCRGKRTEEEEQKGREKVRRKEIEGIKEIERKRREKERREERKKRKKEEEKNKDEGKARPGRAAPQTCQSGSAAASRPCHPSRLFYVVGIDQKGPLQLNKRGSRHTGVRRSARWRQPSGRHNDIDDCRLLTRLHKAALAFLHRSPL